MPAFQWMNSTFTLIAVKFLPLLLGLTNPGVAFEERQPSPTGIRGQDGILQDIGGR
jgi:hypothetical protein